ncbi:type II toxin-antitoxin system VapC family toxin [Streptomyces sp. 6N223]|uniref:type II toxin-antitoxin system VapC family toxin n=1 Tax=Streptomyces sp. 6N223 TaxID=3457412 RepID=UPI003FD22FEC
MIVVDTGPPVSLVDRKDQDHGACRAWLVATNRRDLFVPAPVIAEACYLVGSKLGARAEAVFLRDLANGLYGTVTAVVPEDILRMADLVEQYASLPLGGTDACVVAVAERVKTARIATLDRRRFAVVRPRHVDAFELFPHSL